MDVKTRFNRIIKLQRMLIKEERMLAKENGISLCCISHQLHVFRGIEKLEQAYGLKSTFSLESDGRIAYKRFNLEDFDIFQIGKIKNSVEDLYNFLQAEVQDEDNE